MNHDRRLPEWLRLTLEALALTTTGLFVIYMTALLS